MELSDEIKKLFTSIQVERITSNKIKIWFNHSHEFQHSKIKYYTDKSIIKKIKPTSDKLFKEATINNLECIKKEQL